MTVNNNTSIPRPPTTTSTAQASSTPAAADTTRFADTAELQEYLKNGNEAMSARYQLAGVSEETADPDAKIAASGWVKSFDKGVEERIAKLGPNPTKEDVKKAVNAEYFEQHIGKFAVDRASSRIMARVKEMMSSDTFG